MDSRDELINELRALVAKQAAQLDKQAAQLDKQAARIAELELKLAKAVKDSSTSSKPPSSDIAKPKPKKNLGGRRSRVVAVSLATSNTYVNRSPKIASTSRSTTKSTRLISSVWD